MINVKTEDYGQMSRPRSREGSFSPGGRIKVGEIRAVDHRLNNHSEYGSFRHKSRGNNLSYSPDYLV